MALAGKVAANTIIQVGNKIITTGINLAIIALITRYLGKYGFGQYTTALTFVVFFSMAADLGLTLVTTQLISRPGAHISAVMSNLFAFRAVSAFLIIGLAPLVVLLLPYDAVVKQGVGIAALAMYFFLLCQIFVSLFQKELRTDRIAIAEIISRLLILVLTIWAIATNAGVIGLLWTLTVGNVVSFLFHYLFSRRYVKTSFRFDKKVWIDIISRSWPLIITIVLNLVYLKADILILSFFKSQADVGLYGAAYRVVDVLVTIPFMIGGTILPIFAARWLSNDRENFKRIWQRVFDVSAIIAWPLVIGGFVLAQPIMNLISGPGFEPAGSILKILIIAVGFIFFSSFFSYTMVSFDHQRKLIFAYLLTAATSLILYLILIPKFSYYAAAWVTVYSELLISILAWWVVRRYSQLHLSFKRFSKALLSALLMGLVLNLFVGVPETLLNVFILIGGGILVYFVVLYGLQGVSKQDVIELLPASFNQPKSFSKKA
ncbi:MAG TPA: flippase [bacterium]|nr:flippase [bacterium]